MYKDLTLTIYQIKYNSNRGWNIVCYTRLYKINNGKNMLSYDVLKFLKANEIKYEETNGIIVIDGDLDLGSVESIPKGFNPTIGEHLWLNRLKSIPEGFNPTVGGNLCLSGLKSIPSGFNPTVGWILDLSGLESIPANWRPTNVKGKIRVPEHLKKDLNYCLEMARIDAEFDFLLN